MSRVFIFFLLTIALTPCFAQGSEPVIDSLEIAMAEEEMVFKEDTTSFAFYTLLSDIEFIPGDDRPAIIRDRLSCIEKSIPLHYNDRIHSFINYFTVRDREYTRMVIRRKNIYFPVFEKHLQRYGLPDELKYLSIIESGLNPKAISRARAVGLWQFMYATGRHYNLRADWYIDERMDPEKSTEAACRYLRDLYGMFNDWELALAAYNAGPGNVKKAIRRSGYKKSFWEIYPFLPRETRSYVPQFVAMIYTMNYLEEHNFIQGEHEVLMPHDTLHVDKYLHLETFAKLTEVCLEDLQKLNPSILRNAVPDATKPHIIKIPLVAKKLLDENRLAILDSASKVGRRELEVLARNTEETTYGKDRIVYRVKSGDVLGSIAMRYKVRVEDIKKWNNLNSNIIKIGQPLTIWIKPPAEGTVIASATSAPKVTQPIPVPDSKRYVVQAGDTLWGISKQFEGLTIEKIKELNNLSDSKIQPGQTLIISR
ncbi:MAG: LysM peptidoglycan-binding domain-containing protein [Cyclobacteriaceae bacterium]|nr:LysM peptidoglycan-binding domain-containing protein [Cyclobacteriaceae bacterium]MBX2956531.1 LysM peptidoglycan-binding domain-containing protein [Cyclobacteriaceae bacterium]